jgi:Na+/H+ antiporter NhaC
MKIWICLVLFMGVTFFGHSKDNDVVIENGIFILQSTHSDTEVTLEVNGVAQTLIFSNGKTEQQLSVDSRGELFLIRTIPDGAYNLYHVSLKDDKYRTVRIPLWTSILPPLVAILLALIFKEVILSLFTGVFVGAFLASGLRVEGIFLTFFDVLEKYVLNTLIDKGHMSIIIFSLLIGGMVALISRNGGMAGVVQRLSKFANTPRSAQFITWLLGVAIFFDDYANTLIVGNTMRSVTDKFKISREKLAYIVDSTAAPVASIAFITTWIGAQLSYIADGITGLEGFPVNSTPYAIFFSSLKYSFYPILTLLFILIIIFTKRDFGWMHHYELKALKGTAKDVNASVLQDDLQPVKGIQWKARNAVIPILVVILVTIIGLVISGIENSETISGSFFVRAGTIIGNADSYKALLWASLAGVSVAFLLSISSKIMNLEQGITTLIGGIKTMLPAILILTFAWSLAATTSELHTATFITTALKGNIHPILMPVIVFILAVLISFSTGSSWSTMAILYPIAIPATWAISLAYGLGPEMSFELVLNVISIVMAASVMGDHISPISDTTILSSLAADCNHLTHVKTQMPYSLTVGAFSLLGAVISSFFWGQWLTFFAFIGFATLMLWLIVMRFGKTTL